MGRHEQHISIEYVIDMLGQLGKLAIELDDLFLAYLIGMALEEAMRQRQIGKV